MRRLLNPFVLTLAVILAAAYAYAAWRLTDGLAARLLFALPFMAVWLVPVVYWVIGRESHRRADDLLHAASYISMGWLTYVLLLSLLRDAALLTAQLAGWSVSDVVHDASRTWVLWGGTLALGIGVVPADAGHHTIRTRDSDSLFGHASPARRGRREARRSTPTLPPPSAGQPVSRAKGSLLAGTSTPMASPASVPAIKTSASSADSTGPTATGAPGATKASAMPIAHRPSASHW
jgi:hypothetical protein